uniref:Nicotinate phosphoribosyltransferase n=1 Tax=Culicoides sonorensis TaxID=179676 RepID=A0A336KBU1_CULSO
MSCSNYRDMKHCPDKNIFGYNARNNFYQNGVVQPLLTDLYQITMAYAYWKSGKINDQAVFDVFFRKNPFHGEFTIFAGLEEVLKFLLNFRYSDGDIEYLRETLPQGVEDEFFEYLRNLTADEVTLYACDEGTVVFPKVPLLKIEGPLIVVQLLETTLLTLVNYASLMATNAARYRMVAGKHIDLLEFGLRRAQGPDGGLSASKYAYIGGFDGTSNVLAGKLFNIPVKGTHAHAYITSFSDLSELKTRMLRHKSTGVMYDLLEIACTYRDQLSSILDISTEESSEGELAAMVSYAIAFPDGFMALVDTYDVKSEELEPQNKFLTNGYKPGIKIKNHNLSKINSPKNSITSKNNNNSMKYKNMNGFAQNGREKISQNGSHLTTNHLNNSHANANNVSYPNNDCVVVTSSFNNSSNSSNLLLKSCGKSLRSGLLNFCAVALALHDLCYRPIGVRIDSGDLAYLSCLARQTFEKVAERFRLPWFSKLTIVASNDINEDTILSLNEQGHKIDCFGIGTHLVTCQRQPALGCVYKLVEINEQPRIKLSQDVEKVTMPGNKECFRLYGSDGHALIDLLQRKGEPAPQVGQKVLCRHPFQESKRAYVTPARVETLLKVYWQNGRVAQKMVPLDQVKERVQQSLKTLRQDHKRTLNPTPYKVSVSDSLYNFIHDLWLQNAPIGELS